MQAIGAAKLRTTRRQDHGGRQPVYVLVHPITVNFDNPQHGLPSFILFPSQYRQPYIVQYHIQKASSVSFFNSPLSRNGTPGKKPVSEESSTFMRRPDLLTRNTLRNWNDDAAIQTTLAILPS